MLTLLSILKDETAENYMMNRVIFIDEIIGFTRVNNYA